MFTVKARLSSGRRALMATAAVTVLAGVAGVAHAGTPIDTNQPFYNQSDVGTTVNPDFQGGTLRDNVNGATDNNAYNVENFPTNRLDEFGNTVTFTGAFSGSGPLTIGDSVGGGNAIFTGGSILGGAVTIDPNATLTWGNGTGGAFLVGPDIGVVDNGALVMNFGSGGVAGGIPISGTGSVTIQSGLFQEETASTYTGGTTVDATGRLVFTTNGSDNGSVAGHIADNGLVEFDYTGGSPVTAANSFSGSGDVDFHAGTTVLTGGISTLSGTVTIDSGATAQWGDGVVGAAALVGAGNAVTDNGALVMDMSGGIVGTVAIGGTGTLEIQQGIFEETGAATYSGTTTIDAAGILSLNGAGSIANSGGVIDNGVFDISTTSAGASITTLEGGGLVTLGAQTLTLTNASGVFAGVLSDGGAGGGLTIQLGTETLTGTNTYTGPTTIDLGATLALGNGGATGSVAGDIVDNGLLQFNYSGPVTTAGHISGGGSAEVVAGTAVITNFDFVGGTVTIDSGATMQWGDGSSLGLLAGSTGVVDNGALVVNFGGGGIGTVEPISGTGTFEIQSGSFNNGAVSTYTGTTTIDAAGILAVSVGGSISDSSNVIDNGIFDISGETTGTSITTLDGSGRVQLGNQTLTLTGASGTFSGVIQDPGFFGAGPGGGLTIAAGTETLTGTNIYTGPTTINLGATLALGNGGSTGTVAGDIVDNGLVQFNYGGGPVISNNAFSGGGSVEIVAGTVVETNFGGVSGAVTIDPGATLQWGNAGVGVLSGSSIVDNGTFAIDFGGSTLASGIVVSGTGGVDIKSGEVEFGAVNTYTGATSVDSGALFALVGAGSIANSSNVTANGTFDISGAGAPVSIVSLDGGGLVSLGGNLMTLTNASGNFGGVLADGGIGGGTGGALTIAGGTESLSGVNTFTGLTTVDVGATLKLIGAGSIADSDPLVNGTFDISGASPPGVDITSLSGHGHVILGDNTLTLTAAGDLFSGQITGNGGLTIAAGIEALSGVNTFTGTTLIDPGATLQLGDGAGTMGLLAGPIADNGVLLFNGGTGTFSIFFTDITGTGAAELVSGTLVLGGTNTYTGITQIDSGTTLQLGDGGTTGSVAGDITDNGVLKFDYAPTAAVTTPGNIAGSGSAEVVAGAAVMTGFSVIGGTVTVDSGATLQWGAHGAGLLAGGAGTIDNGAIVADFGGAGVLIGLPISGSGTFEMKSGALNLTGANTYAGTTTIDPGAFLALTLTGSIANSSNVIDNGTFDISGETSGASIVTLEGSGGVSLGGQVLTLTNASGTFSGVLADGGFLGGTGGGLTIAAGTETLTGDNTFTGVTTINSGATLQLGNGGPSGSLAGDVLDNGALLFAYGGSPVTMPGVIAGSGSAELLSGTLVVTGPGVIGGAVTIDTGATMQWGNGNAAFLIGGTGVVDNGHLVMDFGGGGVGTTSVISGSGDVTLQSGSFNTGAVNTYTGPTTIDSGALFLVSGGGSIATSSNVIDNGFFDISGLTGAGTSITSLSGTGDVALGGKLLTLTNASGTFGGVIGDGGVFGGSGGGLTIAGGIETLTGTNIYTNLTTIDPGATLQLGAGGTTGTVAGPILDNGQLNFNYGGAVTLANDVGGTGSAELQGGTLVVTGFGVVGGNVTIDPGATMQWGHGAVGFLIGGSGVVDNGALVMDFGSNGLAVGAPISGAGSVTIQSGAFISSAVNTYTGVTTIDSGAAFRLSGTGSIADSSNVIDNGQFDIFGTTAGASIKTLSGSGGGFLGAQTLTLTDASGTFSGGLSDGFGGTGGGLTIAGGAETLTGANTFTGLTTIDAGARLQLGAGGPTGSVAGNILDNGTLVFDRSNFLFVDGAISGNGAIDQIGEGTTVLDAVNPFNGLTTVSDGTLMVGDASHAGAVLGGDVLVGPDGRLEGHGTIGGAVTNNGVVAPGGTIGTLTVGSFTQGPGGTLAIEVSPPVASQLNVIGAASLNGALALTFDPGVYTNHIYDILNGHPVTGTFASVSTTGSPGPGMTFGIFYAPTQVDLVTEATGSSQIYGGVSAATIDRAQNFTSLVEDRFGDAGCANGSPDRAACGGYGAWAFAIGSWQRQGADGGAFGFRNSGAGVVAGLDRSTAAGSVLGASFGYAHNDLDMGEAASKASGPSYFGAIYGRLVDGGLWFDGQLFYMHSDWSVSRTMTGLGVASAHPNADSEGFLLQASLPIGDTGLRPYARFTYVLSNRGGVLENGVGPLGFQIDSAKHSAAVGEIGLRYEAVFGTAGGMQVRPSLQVGVQGNAGDRDQLVTGSLFGLPGSAFAQVAPRFWHVAGVADGAVKVQVNQKVELFGDVQGRFSGNQTDAVASVGGVIRF